MIDKQRYKKIQHLELVNSTKKSNTQYYMHHNNKHKNYKNVMQKEPHYRYKSS